MYPPHLTYLMEKGTTWFDPCYALTKFWDKYRELRKENNLSHEQVWGHRDFREVKEIFATSIVAKATAKTENKRWWIHKPKIDPPDGIIGTIIRKGDIEEMHVREVEVVEHLSGEIEDTLKKKLNDNRYEPNTILVCYVTHGGMYDFRKLSEVFSGNTFSLQHIFLVFIGLQVSDIPSDARGDDLLRAMFKISPMAARRSANGSAVPLGA